MWAVEILTTAVWEELVLENM